MSLSVTHANRVVYSSPRRTKGDVVSFYEEMADRIWPHVVGRPLVIRRYPRGVGAPGFYQHGVPPYYPSSIGRFEIVRFGASVEPANDVAPEPMACYPVPSEARHLAYLANQGAVELHLIASAAGVERLVVDLDPPKGAVAMARRAALLIRGLLREAGLESVAIATGAKGYHVVVPLDGTVAAEGVADAARKLVAVAAARHPDLFTTAFAIADRGRRVFLDWRRNRPGAVGVAPYSLRAKARATVAVPIAWDEIDAIAPDHFTIDDVSEILHRPDSLLACPLGDARGLTAFASRAVDAEGLVLEAVDLTHGC